MPVPRRFDRQPPERDNTRINERIRVPEVRLIGDDGEQVGVMKTPDALAYAVERELDLVEVAPDAKPPVCRILDYSKYKYEKNQREKSARKHQQQIVVREIKFRPKIAEHDYMTKKGHVERFLNHRDKVKVTIMFRGREVAHPERGEIILNRLAEELSELAIVEQRPQQDGRNMTMMLGPSKAAGTDEAEAPAAPAEGVKPSAKERARQAATSPPPAPEAVAPTPEAEATTEEQPEPPPEPEVDVEVTEPEGPDAADAEPAPEPELAAEVPTPAVAEEAPAEAEAPKAEAPTAAKPKAAAKPKPKAPAKPKAAAKPKAPAKPKSKTGEDAAPAAS